jgi:hypothetical protein
MDNLFYGFQWQVKIVTVIGITACFKKRWNQTAVRGFQNFIVHLKRYDESSIILYKIDNRLKKF